MQVDKRYQLLRKVPITRNAQTWGTDGVCTRYADSRRDDLFAHDKLVNDDIRRERAQDVRRDVGPDSVGDLNRRELAETHWYICLPVTARFDECAVAMSSPNRRFVDTCHVKSLSNAPRQYWLPTL